MQTNITHRLGEMLLDHHLDNIDSFSEDTLMNLDGIAADLSYVSRSLEQVQTRFKKVVDENRKLKTFLRRLVKECWCLEGNRCAQCQNILATLTNFIPPAIAKTANLQENQD